MESAAPYNQQTPDTVDRGEHQVVVCYVDKREQLDVGKAALEQIGWRHWVSRPGARGYWMCPLCRHPGVQTSADASGVQTSADAPVLAPLLAALQDDRAEPVTGLQAVEAVIGQLRALEDFLGEAREFVAIDPDFWMELKIGLIRFLEDTRVGLKLLRGAR